MPQSPINEPGIKIAYADDHVMVRKGISEFINSFDDCSVIIEADNGKDLLLKLEAATILPDICILDIFMPEMNGLETLLAIGRKWRDIKVIVLTGHNTDYYLIQMIRAGAKGYLQKNCSPKELELAIKMVYEHNRYNSELLSFKYNRELRNKDSFIRDFNEQEIGLLKHCCSDMSYTEIALKMGESVASIDWTRKSLFKKLNVNTRSSLVFFAIQFGLVEIDIDETGRSLSAP